MRLIAIDPGTERSAWVVYGTADGLNAFGITANADMLSYLGSQRDDLHREPEVLAIEMVACYGQRVGREIFETCVWTGRFIEAWGGPWHKVYRRDVKLHLCNSARAKDANVRAALIDRFGPGKAKAVGTVKAKGPLHGVSKDVWQALGVAVYYADRVEREASMELVGSQVDVKA